MTTFRIDEEGNFMPFEPTRAEELEAKLEDWMEHNDHVLLAPGRLLWVGSQVRTDLNRAIDLLGIDDRRRTVVVELKKDRTPRDMVAQALEYAAFVRPLSYDELNSLATPYFARTGSPWTSLEEAHQEFFGRVDEQPWNSSLSILLVGQTIQPDIIEVARYLRDHNIDIRVLQFVYQESSSGERLVTVQTVVGGDTLPTDAAQGATVPQPALEEVLLSTPSLTPAFESLIASLQGLSLPHRRTRTLVAFDHPAGGALLNVWPSTSGKVFMLVMGRRASELGDLDSFSGAASDLGLVVRRGRTDVSVHLAPKDVAIVQPLVAAFADKFLGMAVRANH